MIPPRMLKQLAQTLTEQTKAGAISWDRQLNAPQRYQYQLPSGQVVVRYDPSRGGADSIELAVLDFSGEVIGSLIGQESEPIYDVLADLLFEIQRATDHGPMRQVTDDILRLLKS
jgi:hypothetical protein